MRNCDLLSSMSVNSGVASNLSRDLISQILLDNEKLKPEYFPKITEIKTRLKYALMSCEQLERIANAAKENYPHHD